MTWNFEKVAGPYTGAMGGLAWDGKRMLFALVDEGYIHAFDPETGKTAEARRYTSRVNGIAFGPDGTLFGCQEGGRRVIQFLNDGSACVTATRLDGKIHNFPSDLVVDKGGRIWFADPHHPVYAFGPQLFPALSHASVLRIERDERRAWKIRRITYDTKAPRSVLLSPDEKTLYVADGEPGRDGVRELRAYPVNANGEVDPCVVFHTFGADQRGPHRGIEGMCLDADGNIVACAGWRKSGPGPLVHVFSPSGAVLESHAIPGDMPMHCAFGDADLSSLYVTAGDGCVYRARSAGRRGFKRW